MTTPEQIQAWVDEAIAHRRFKADTSMARVMTNEDIERLCTLARADLVAERDALMVDYNNVSAENEELRTKMLAMACAQVDRKAALRTHPAPQAKKCHYGDPLCPCQDGHQCHYEGKDAWPAPQAVPAWLPIESAPQNTAVDLWCRSQNNQEYGKRVTSVCLVGNDWYGGNLPNPKFGEYASHWMPLPAAPAVKGE